MYSNCWRINGQHHEAKLRQWPTIVTVQPMTSCLCHILSFTWPSAWRTGFPAMTMSLSRTSRKLNECDRPTSSISVWCSMWPTSMGKLAAVSPPSTMLAAAEWLSSCIMEIAITGVLEVRDELVTGVLEVRWSRNELSTGRTSVRRVQVRWDRAERTADNRRLTDH